MRKREHSSDKLNSGIKSKVAAKAAGKATPHASAMKRDISKPRADSISKRSLQKPQINKFGLSRNSVKPPTKKTSTVQTSKLSASQGRLKNAHSAMGTTPTAISLKIPGAGLTSSQHSGNIGQNATQTLKSSMLDEEAGDVYKGRCKFKNSIVSAGGHVGSGRSNSSYQRGSADKRQ